jgi:hypothetical protein
MIVMTDSVLDSGIALYNLGWGTVEDPDILNHQMLGHYLVAQQVTLRIMRLLHGVPIKTHLLRTRSMTFLFKREMMMIDMVSLSRGCYELEKGGKGIKWKDGTKKLSE